MGVVQEWLLDEGYCCAGALANLEDGAMYAAAPAANEEGWGLIFAEPHEEEIMQEDMTTKKVTVDEAVCLHAVISTGKKHANGIWIGGEKYNMTKCEKETIAEKEAQHIFCNRPKKGVHIIATETNIVVAMFNEEKGAAQNGGNCAKAAVAFTEYLIG